jgi:menaquinone-9 beta-reductase
LQSILQEVPALRVRLHDAIPCWQKPLAISPIPYGHLGGPADGVWRVGDQAAVIPSFTGDGMSIALHSAMVAADMYLGGNTADACMRLLADQLRPAMRFSTGLSRMMVTPVARTISPFLLSIVPNAMARIASSTRIPESALMTIRTTAGAPINRYAAPIS